MPPLKAPVRQGEVKEGELALTSLPFLSPPNYPPFPGTGITWEAGDGPRRRVKVRSTLQAQGKVLQKIVYVLNKCPIYGALFPIARIHRSRNQGVEMKVHHSLLSQ